MKIALGQISPGLDASVTHLVNLARLEHKLLVLTEPIGLPVYDFDFDLHFDCRHPSRIEVEELCVLRIGPISDYATEFAARLGHGLRLINTPEEHRLASELECWYPLIRQLTPRTQVFAQLPSVEEIEANFRWPIFLKGSRQTSRHDPALSIIENKSHYEWAVRQYANDAILHWQKPVVREFVPLQPVPGQVAGKIRPSMEYRSFWWHGECVGWGRYWFQIEPYAAADVAQGLAVAATAARRLHVPFLVVDFAQTRAGDWIVIECNDAQESGYAGVVPYELWRQILARIGS